MTRSYEAGPSTAAALLQLARLKAGLTQAAMAELAGVPATMISAYERDKRQPTLETLMRLLAAAGFEVRMRLEPLDEHDSTLGQQPGSAARHRRHVAAWRNAEEVHVG